MAFTPPIEGVDNRRAIYGKFSAGIEGLEAEFTAQIGLLGFFSLPAPPGGWLEANGGECPAEASTLSTLLNGRHGVGPNGRSLLPDVRGEFLRGYDNGRGVDPGRSLGGFQGDEFRQHSHLLNTLLNATGFSSSLVGQVIGGSLSGIGGGDSGIAYTGGPETRPRNLAMLICIFAGV